MFIENRIDINVLQMRRRVYTVRQLNYILGKCSCSKAVVWGISKSSLSFKALDDSSKDSFDSGDFGGDGRDSCFEDKLWSAFLAFLISACFFKYFCACVLIWSRVRDGTYISSPEMATRTYKCMDPFPVFAIKHQTLDKCPVLVLRPLSYASIGNKNGSTFIFDNSRNNVLLSSIRYCSKQSTLPCWHNSNISEDWRYGNFSIEDLDPIVVS